MGNIVDMSQSLPDTSPRAIGSRLTKVRDARGWSQKQLCEMLEISTQRWNRYERGLSIPPAQLLGKFWQMTGATSDYILFDRIDTLPHELALKLREIPDGEGRKRA